MSRKLVWSRELAAAFARLSDLMGKGERAFDAELRRRIAAAAFDAGSNDSGGDPTEVVGPADPPAATDGLAEIKRLRDVIDLALALLDELLEARPDERDRVLFQDIADVFGEIREFAAVAATAARSAANGEIV